MFKKFACLYKNLSLLFTIYFLNGVVDSCFTWVILININKKIFKKMRIFFLYPQEGNGPLKKKKQNGVV